MQGIKKDGFKRVISLNKTKIFRPKSANFGQNRHEPVQRQASGPKGKI